MSAQHKISVTELVSSIGGELKIIGANDRCVSTISRIAEANNECVTFCNKKGENGV